MKSILTLFLMAFFPVVFLLRLAWFSYLAITQPSGDLLPLPSVTPEEESEQIRNLTGF